MINTEKFMEAFLQKKRFAEALPYLQGDVLDFGGNRGELKKYVKHDYTLVNYDYTLMEGKTFDTIVALAVLEHLSITDSLPTFKKLKSVLRPKGIIILTTPVKIAKPFLELIAFMNIIDKKNIAEHKHYWNREEIFVLAERTGLVVKKYHKFQWGFNQFAVLKHKKNCL